MAPQIEQRKKQLPWMRTDYTPLSRLTASYILDKKKIAGDDVLDDSGQGQYGAPERALLVRVLMEALIDLGSKGTRAAAAQWLLESEESDRLTVPTICSFLDFDYEITLRKLTELVEESKKLTRKEWMGYLRTQHFIRTEDPRSIPGNKGYIGKVV